MIEDDDRTAARGTTARTVALVLLGLTVAQLAVAVLAPDLPQFEGKAFLARLVLYPVMMLLAPALWALHRRRAVRAGGTPGPLPWDGFAWIMAPFLVDVTGNSLDLYDRVPWWDDLNHLVNWFMLCLGAGLLLRRGRVSPRWALGLLVTGVGALLAIGWELGEWVGFIRQGTELASAYTDTLGDQALGSIGAALAGVLLARRERTAADGAADG